MIGHAQADIDLLFQKVDEAVGAVEFDLQALMALDEVGQPTAQLQFTKGRCNA
ncbi:hypothetical protein D3C80_1927410 [compost metagenome]